MARRRRRQKSLFGRAAASDMNPMWGAVASGAVGTGAAVAVQSFSGMDKHSELIGLGAGVATGAVLMLGKKTRAAGVTGVATAVVVSGIRAVQAMMSAKQKMKDIKGAEATFLATKAAVKVPMKDQLAAYQAAAKAGGFGIVSPERVPTLGAISAQQIPTMNGGLGAISAQQVPTMGGGGLGIVSPEVIRSLSGGGIQGGGLGAAVKFQGGGGSLSSAYGATIYGNN
jgi:hypothetical protein